LSLFTNLLAHVTFELMEAIYLVGRQYASYAGPYPGFEPDLVGLCSGQFIGRTVNCGFVVRFAHDLAVERPAGFAQPPAGYDSLFFVLTLDRLHAHPLIGRHSDGLHDPGAHLLPS
jgi:hypothetical protein